MEFRIADTFTDSLSKLTAQEQKAVKMAAFDLQLNPATPGMRFHKLDRAKDPNFWSISVNMDVRLIVHKTASSLLLCYVDHHDNAYIWASRRKIEQHPKTGAAQLVEVRERVEEIISYPTPDLSVSQKPLLFAGYTEDELLSYGVPHEWLNDVCQATEDTLFDLSEQLPQEAIEALLELATGGQPQRPKALPALPDPFSHPDSQRRFRIMINQEVIAVIHLLSGVYQLVAQHLYGSGMAVFELSPICRPGNLFNRLGHGGRGDRGIGGLG